MVLLKYRVKNHDNLSIICFRRAGYEILYIKRKYSLRILIYLNVMEWNSELC